MAETTRGQNAESSRVQRVLVSPILPRGFLILGPNEVVMGRGVSCQIPLLSHGVSRQHAKVFSDGETHAIMDMGSTNGTFVNGELIKKSARRLRSGDAIRIGSFSLKFVVTSASRDELVRDYEPREASTPVEGTNVQSLKKREAAQLAGTFADLVLVDTCQLLEMNEDSGEMRIETNGLHGQLRFVRGTIVDARLGGETGEKAARRILGAAKGEYEFRRDPPGVASKAGPLKLKPSALAVSVSEAQSHQLRMKATDEFPVFADDATEVWPGGLAAKATPRPASETRRISRMTELVNQKERLSQELKTASRIQKKLIPEEAMRVPGLEISGKSVPAAEVGGDVLDFFSSGGTVDGKPVGQMFISIGDVSGKGAGAGIVMATVRATLRAKAERETRTDVLLGLLNRELAKDLEAGLFVSLLLLRWSPYDRTLAWAGAGHEHILVIRARTGAVETLRSGGVVLGLTADVTGKIEEKKLNLEPNDIVVLYTDGLTEAMSPGGEELGLERVEQALLGCRGKSAPEVIDALIATAQAWQRGEPAHDDLTIVALRKTTSS
jgi:serine phosphatase RsbU (regulator of sigma subunit)